MSSMNDSRDATASLYNNERNSLTIAVLHREHPDSTDVWDANWLAAHIEIRGHNINGTCGASLLTQDIAALKDRVAETLGGRASGFEFSATEGRLSLRAVRKATGVYEM